MGLAASQGRFLALTARKSNLEYNGQLVNQERMTISNNTQSLFTQAELLNDPNSAQYQNIMNQIDSLHSRDVSLELDLRNLDTQQKEVQTEIDAVQKVIDKNIDMTFKTFA